MRGHCVTWGVEQRVPEWLMNMTAEQVQSEVSDRITGVVSYFRDRCVTKRANTATSLFSVRLDFLYPAMLAS